MAGLYEGPKFSQEEIAVLRDALAKASAALRLAYPGGVPDSIRERLAFWIVEFASGGDSRPSRLCALSLSELQLAEAISVPRRGVGLPRRTLKAPAKIPPSRLAKRHGDALPARR